MGLSWVYFARSFPPPTGTILGEGYRSIITILLVAVAVFIAFRKYKARLENQPKKRIRSKSKSIQSNATDSGQAISIGGSNFAPIIQGIDNKRTRPDLTRLTEIREKGYLLRNKGMYLEDEKFLHLWVDDFELWNTEMLQALGELDRDKARVLTVLGNIPRGTIYYPRVFDEMHALKLDVFTEKLARLDKIIDDYLKIPVPRELTIKTPVPGEMTNVPHSDFSDFSNQLDNMTRGKKNQWYWFRFS